MSDILRSSGPRPSKPVPSGLFAGSLAQRARLISGLILFGFALGHLLNHALGIWSVEVMDRAQDIRTAFTRFPPVSAVIMAAFAVHIVLGFVRLFQRDAWAMPWWAAFQALLGIALPIWLLRHIINTFGPFFLVGVDTSYSNVIGIMWKDFWYLQFGIVLLVWVHACVGLHFWLRLWPPYQRIQLVLLALAAIIPALSLAGFVSAGRQVAAQASRSGLQFIESAPDLTPQQIGQRFEFLSMLTDWSRYGTWIVWGLLAALIIGRLVWRRLGRRVTINYAGSGRSVASPIGPTLLEISQANEIPHAAVCGGRARCSTCRVEVLDGLETLPPPEPAEERTLKRIKADSDVRLACQIKPTGDLRVKRLISPVATATSARGFTRGEAEGAEHDLAVLFLDIRGFTAMSDVRLPYDVVFILNRFFRSIGTAIESEHGWIDKYMGDGLMAVFGYNEPIADRCRNALAAAKQIDFALEKVNQELSGEIDVPLRIGMGIQMGPLILGKIGHEGSAAMTVIGRTVNVASRFEGLTKELGVQLIASEAIFENAGISTEPFERRSVEVRGSNRAHKVVLVENGRDLPDLSKIGTLEAAE